MNTRITLLLMVAAFSPPPRLIIAITASPCWSDQGYGWLLPSLI
jgi:hypothetical protein